MKRQRRILRWWMPQNCAPTGTSCSTHRIRVERLEDRNYLASDLAEESAISSHWKEDAKVEATDSFVDVAYAEQNQVDDEPKAPVFDSETLIDALKGDVADHPLDEVEAFEEMNAYESTENTDGTEQTGDTKGGADTEDFADTEETKETEDTDSIKDVKDNDQGEVVGNDDNAIDDDLNDDNAIDNNVDDEQPDAVEKPTVEPSDEVPNADDYNVEWIEDVDTETDPNHSDCPIDPETGYETFCQGTEVPGKTKPDRHVDSPSSTESDKKPKEAESISEFIPTINTGRRERIASSAAPMVELGRPHLYGLPQLTIDPNRTMESTEAVRLNVTSQDKVDFANAKVIEAGSSSSRRASKSNATDIKNLADAEKPSAKPLNDASSLRFQQSKWRRSIESLRPLISQIPWISPLLKRSTSETEKNKVDDSVEPGTVGMQPRELYQSPSDKPMHSSKEPSHTKTNATGEQSPISSRATQSMVLPAQATRNNENAPDSKSLNPIEEPPLGNRHLGLFFPALIGLTLGKNFWWFAKKQRNKPVSKRPLPIDNDRSHPVSNR